MTVPSAPSGPLPAERLLGGRYRLGPVIGRGGMATIHRARDLRSDRDVAIKLLRREVADDRDLAHRFRREALAATVLRHPNIVACFGTGTDGDQPYLVMDLVEGEDLAGRLRRSGRLAPWHAARIGLDVARALGVAHIRGIVHRDIKPANILLAADGRAMVTDFGIARLAADAEAAFPGTTLGSVHYFSPEQARGTTTTPASDVYGLGLVLFEALTGMRPFTGDTSDAIALARVGAPAPSPRAIRPEIPAALEAVVRRALAPDPVDRYPNGVAMAAALEPSVRAQEVGVPTPITTIGVAPPSSRQAPMPFGRPDRRAPARARAGAVRRSGGSAPVGRTRPRARRMRIGRTALELPAFARPSFGLRAFALPRPIRRGGPSGIVAAVAIVVVVSGALLMAALPGVGATPTRPGPTGTSVAAVPGTTEGERTPAATPEPTDRATASATPAPTVEPAAVPPGDVADLCDIFFDIPCALARGRYAPSRVVPAFDVELGEGWSSAAHAADSVVFTRAEGAMTFAGRIAEVYPNGEVREPRARPRAIIEAFIATNGVSATRPANVRIDGRRGLSTDLTPIDSARVELFATAGTTYFLEPDLTTRVVVMDLRDDTILLAIEPHAGYDLEDILETADVVAGTIRWR